MSYCHNTTQTTVIKSLNLRITPHTYILMSVWPPAITNWDETCNKEIIDKVVSLQNCHRYLHPSMIIVFNQKEKCYCYLKDSGNYNTEHWAAANLQYREDVLSIRGNNEIHIIQGRLYYVEEVEEGERPNIILQMTIKRRKKIKRNIRQR